MTGLLRSAVTIALLGLSLRTFAAERGTTADDLKHRDGAIHWPKQYEPRTAIIFSHNEALIHADCHRVFGRMTDVTDWPNWFLLTKDVEIDGVDKRVQNGTLLRLNIFGSPITARIDEFVPDSRLSWIPQGVGEDKPHHYHTWHFVPESEGCRVVTEEAGIGPGDVEAGKSGSNMMHRAHDLWLASLRWTSEE